ncbi:MAG: galactitol-1-phosphate 5-dehydrogenase [Bacteroidales bacterium]|jgi:L-iditol 2-dehydrogenase|nr:galactitol-1-phosphate 5-dehydrogenase [Bacteroidales bacterium]
MKALVLEEYNKLVYKDVPDAVAEDGEVLVEVKAVGICGSDVHGMDGSTGRRIPPIIMGHEASGVIKRCGKDVHGWSEGDRVTFDSTIYRLDDWYTRRGHYNLSDNRMVLGVSCKEFRRNGAFAGYVSVPAHILYRIPDNVTFEQAAMAEPVAVALHAVNLSGVRLNDTVAVFGSGMIGLFIIRLLKLAGCRVIAVDIAAGKLRMAESAGADFVVNSSTDDAAVEILRLTGGRGADAAFEAVGITQSVNSAIDSIRKGSVLVLVGNLSPVVELPLQKIVTREITIKGSCAINGEYPAVLDLISQGKIDVGQMISIVAPLSEGSEFFKRLYSKEAGLMKVILKP